MAAKKSVQVLLGLLIMSGWVLGATIQAEADTLKLQVSTIVAKGEQIPVDNIEGTVINSMIKNGLFVSENGELGSMKFIGNACNTAGKGGSFLGYVVFIFGDGSTIVGTFQSGTSWPDPEGKFSGIQKSPGELIIGSGRFKGIKGTLAMTGKLLKTIKGELSSKSYNEFILDYTLSQ